MIDDVRAAMVAAQSRNSPETDSLASSKSLKRKA